MYPSLPNLVLRATVLTALLLVTTNSNAAGQTPELVADEALTALDSAYWPRLVRLAHPEALDRFQAEQLSEARDEDADKSDSDLAPEEKTHVRMPWYAMLYKVQSAHELAAMSATEMLSRYLAGTHGVRYAVTPGGQVYPALGRFRIVGTVFDGDSTAYVVFVRFPLGGYEHSGRETAPEIMTLRRDRIAWKIMLDGGVVWGRGGFAIGFAR